MCCDRYIPETHFDTARASDWKLPRNFCTGRAAAGLKPAAFFSIKYSCPIRVTPWPPQNQVHSIVRMSINPVTSNISIMISGICLNTTCPCLFMRFCAARTTRRPAEDRYPSFSISRTRPSCSLHSSSSSSGTVAASSRPSSKTVSFVFALNFVSVTCITHFHSF